MARPGHIWRGLARPDQALPVLATLCQAGQPGLAMRGQAKLSLPRPAHAWLGLAKPGQAQTSLAKPGHAWLGWAKPGQTWPGVTRRLLGLTKLPFEVPPLFKPVKALSEKGRGESKGDARAQKEQSGCHTDNLTFYFRTGGVGTSCQAHGGRILHPVDRVGGDAQRAAGGRQAGGRRRQH